MSMIALGLLLIGLLQYKRKSCRGLAISMFILAVGGNVMYTLSVFLKVSLLPMIR